MKELDPYTPRERDRLGTFHNILDRVMDTEDDIRTNKETAWGRVENGCVVEKWMPLDPRFVYTWEHIAQTIYEDEFAGKPHMERAVEGIRNELRLKYDPTPQAMTPDEMQRLMEITDELNQLGGEDNGF